MTDEQDHPAGELYPVTFPGGVGYQATHLAAFSAFYRQFIPTLIGFLMWQGATLSDAAEIAQETMTRVWQQWPEIQHPQAWARKVAGRALVRRVASTTEYPVADVPERSALLPPNMDIAAWEQRHDILTALRELPPRQRQVLIWTLDDYTPTEIANMLQITPEAVRSNLFKARRKISLQLSPGEEP
ncbi:RNA polymerase sigma factor [Nocardia anaemiae]|uniref:RNA polymerase sigma factor n=1 Tax=Nocardia anaemiae TaxID=263910 RepID=UPI000A0063BE|nr:sigma-70 family RNA polymerase sigma factor [Nocardia anaemiae]